MNAIGAARSRLAIVMKKATGPSGQSRASVSFVAGEPSVRHTPISTPIT